eukprot:COSAG01_NODE_11234_length_1976_cov_9.516249_1_plen_79_part_10
MPDSRDLRVAGAAARHGKFSRESATSAAATAATAAAAAATPTAAPPPRRHPATLCSFVSLLCVTTVYAIARTETPCGDR